MLVKCLNLFNTAISARFVTKGHSLLVLEPSLQAARKISNKKTNRTRREFD